MLFVLARTAMLDIFALAFSLFGIAAFLFGFRQARPHLSFALAGTAFGFSAACKWSGLFPLVTCIAVVAAIRLMQGWRTQFADARKTDWYRSGLWPDFRARHFALCFMLLPAAAYLSSFVALYGFSISDLLEAQRRIFSDNTTTAIAGHTYMSSWPSWPFLVRPVWFLFDNLGNEASFGGGMPRQSAGAVAGAAGTRGLLPAISSWHGAPMPSSRSRSIWALARLGAAAAHPRFYLLLSAVGDDREPCPGLCPAPRGHAALAVMGLCGGRSARLCRHAACFGGIHWNLDADLPATDDLPELDLSRAPR